jgi:hypothetical protein
MGRFDVMATNTPNLNLKKPSYTDPVDIADLNGNMDKIDQQIGILSNPVYVESFKAIAPEADDTGRVQRALDSISSGIVIFASKTYTTGNLTISNKTNFQMLGYGATIQLNGTATSGNNIGFQLSGTLDNVSIEGFTIIGSGNVGDAHAGIYSASGQTLKNVRTLYNKIQNVIVGISYNADLSGNVDGGLIMGNIISNIVGINPGQGYGIHHSNGNGTPSNLVIMGNRVDGAQRHSIYQARGSGVVITANRIYNHRNGVADGSVRPAINISRSQDIIVNGNTVRDFYDGAFYVDIDTGSPARNINVFGNEFNYPKNAVSPIWIGYLTTISGVLIEEVSFNNNHIIMDGFNVSPVSLNCGKRLNIKNNTVTILNNTTSVNAFVISALSETANTTTYSDDWEIEGNTIYSNASSTIIGFRLNPTFTNANVNTRFKGNKISGAGTAQMFDQAVTVNNPNIKVLDQETTGLSLTSGVTLKPNNLNGATATTVGSAGTASALPTAPLGYLVTQVNGSTVKIPYYNV